MVAGGGGDLLLDVWRRVAVWPSGGSVCSVVVSDFGGSGVVSGCGGGSGVICLVEGGVWLAAASDCGAPCSVEF